MEAETANRILQTGKVFIADRGYSGFSYADIADAIHIRKASIHYHFPTKAKLVVSLLRSHREQMLQGTQSLADKIADPMNRLRKYMQYWEGCIRDKSQPFCIAALLAAELPGLPEEVRFEVHAYFRALGDWLRQTLEEGVEKGVFKLQTSAKDEAQVLMAAVHGAMLSARALDDCAVFHAVTAGALRQLVSTAA